MARGGPCNQYTNATALPLISCRYLCLIGDAKQRRFVLIMQTQHKQTYTAMLKPEILPKKRG